MYTSYKGAEIEGVRKKNAENGINHYVSSPKLNQLNMSHPQNHPPNLI